MGERIDLATAASLLDFTGGDWNGVISPSVAKEQLRGAVAVHNLLQDQGVAYLADEVGMGKTYVALGAMALLRHFRPELRVLVIAPRQNIQDKWMKDWANFTRRVVRVEDLRVKGLGGYPARALVKVNSLVDLVHEASRDPDRDFFMRLTSFSLPVSGVGKAMQRRKDQLLRALPWLDDRLLDARNKERYKRNIARAVNCALPHFDLVILDEGHNLKAGWHETRSSIRNTVLACALAARDLDDPDHRAFKGYGSRLSKLLVLSATPIENDFTQLWNQLDLLGMGNSWRTLRDRKLEDEVRKADVKKMLIRRTVSLPSPVGALTKSEYRREWRGGGVKTFDEHLVVNGDRARLAVALMQKKVTELMGAGEKKHSFQVGLLASFESFLQTARVSARQAAVAASGDEEEAEDNGAFHRSPEEIATDRNESTLGLDVDAVNRISRDHLRVFGKDLPHPKMDAMVEELASSFRTGRKALVFVRRVASVDELQRKLEERYDDLIIEKLLAALATDSLREEMRSQVEAYHEERKGSRHDMRATDGLGAAGGETSGVDSFFAWFFRGDGPKGVRSGASLATQTGKESGSYGTLFEDNHVARILSCKPDAVVAALAANLGTSREAALGQIAERVMVPASQRHRPTRLSRFLGCQVAALELLALHSAVHADEARAVLEQVFPERRAGVGRVRPSVDIGAERWLAESTLFSSLRLRPSLHQALWPEPRDGGLANRIREREQRRLLLSVMVRKGHPIIDLFVIIANRLGSLRQGTQEAGEDDGQSVASEFLDLLERQRDLHAGEFGTFEELRTAASSFDLLIQLNAPRVIDAPLADLAREFGTLLSAQRPVAGMAGKVNTVLVRQFRMPGYPLILITTDLLKEGEDLHTFCSSVHHYGIAWMPSELEQRVGRIDRVGSQTERRLRLLDTTVEGHDKLQVFYPHLKETVEVVQVNRVFERLNRFLRMMHEGLGTPERESAFVDVALESLKPLADIEPIDKPLRSAFPVTEAMLIGDRRPLAITEEEAALLRQRFEGIRGLLEGLGARGVTLEQSREFKGEFKVGNRVQPFVLMLRSVRGHPMIRCVSPIGSVDCEDWDDEHARGVLAAPFTRIALVCDERFENYDIAAEGDILLGDVSTDHLRARRLLESVLKDADNIEKELLKTDAPLEVHKSDMEKEGEVAR